MTTDHEAQRAHRRVNVRLGVEIETATDSFTAYTRDVSVGGAALVCERPLHDGDGVRLALFVVYDGIEDERIPPLITSARVQWAAETDDGSHSAGVHFEGMTQAQAQWLGQVLARQQQG